MPQQLRTMLSGALEPWLGIFQPDTTPTEAVAIISTGVAASVVMGTHWAMLWLFVGAMALDMGAGSLASMLDPNDRFCRDRMMLGIGKKLMGLVIVIAAHILDLAFLAMGADPAEFGLVPEWASALVAHPLTVVSLIGLLLSEIASVFRNARKVRDFGPIVTGLMDAVINRGDPRQ